ncbi:UNVERIFIED_ORG: sigma-B regulation protein RsbQ [Methylobacterium sp. SuP10 SLI 274]|nr:sigma-B regulation protein RsbQ [Methylorubrum extorquens]MDF9790665.1 sigma-B regulation protein RsbQ [Methylorubrum extorquens]MDF9862371.1 sigma-B regulation protein RsbQ [Methylorubrum pseudosasae]MDH6635986.1 sigma-B regulation protein RsbQ [Methylobacterium sp. SuP10 SLI 274]MDH6665160.1 sigma-B regulation protein RsbQ [Methylorubrum zatmanii]
MSVVQRHNVRQAGTGATPMVFAHGFGCDQNMWRFVAPAFEEHYRTIVFDHIGAGGSDLAAYEADRHASLDGYADDVVALCRGLSVVGGVFVGHSVSAMIGVLAAKKAPELFESLVLVCPSPRYLDDDGYVGGFTRRQVEELLDLLDTNYMGWSQAMAPSMMGNADRPELGEELTNSFCRTDPDIAKRFARTTFLADNRADLAGVEARCLVIQSSEDVIAPLEVGAYVHRHLANSELALLDATGHCPNLSAPAETIAAIQAFLRGPSRG